MLTPVAKLLLATIAFSASASALSNIQVPASLSSGGPITVTWSSDVSDTEWMTLALYSTHPTYNGPFAIANNVNPHANKASFVLPQVNPGSGFTLRFISMSDTSKIYASSSDFAIGPPTSEPRTTITAKPTGTSSHVPVPSASHLSMKPMPVSISMTMPVSGVHSISMMPVSASTSHALGSTAPSSVTATAISSATSFLSSGSASVSGAHSTASASVSASATAKTGAGSSIHAPGFEAVIFLFGTALQLAMG